MTLQIEKYVCEKTGRVFAWVQDGESFRCSECGGTILMRSEVPKLRGRQA